MKIVDDMANHDSTHSERKASKNSRKELPSSYFFAIVQVKKGSSREFLCETEATWKKYSKSGEMNEANEMGRSQARKAMNLRGKINRIKFYDHLQCDCQCRMEVFSLSPLTRLSKKAFHSLAKKHPPFLWPELMVERRENWWNGHKNFGLLKHIFAGLSGRDLWHVFFCLFKLILWLFAMIICNSHSVDVWVGESFNLTWDGEVQIWSLIKLNFKWENLSAHLNLLSSELYWPFHHEE